MWWIFAASLELVKEGVVKVTQSKMFDKLMIKKIKCPKKTNIIKFPAAPSKLERQVEAILFAAAEPLDIETIEKRVQTQTNIKKILENIKIIYKNRGIN